MTLDEALGYLAIEPAVWVRTGAVRQDSEV
jgi:hypothetical protein